MKKYDGEYFSIRSRSVTENGRADSRCPILYTGNVQP